jgi:hypothetical protein
MLDAASAFRTWSADQRWRFVNEACIVDLLDKPVARIDKHAIRAPDGVLDGDRVPRLDGKYSAVESLSPRG